MSAQVMKPIRSILTQDLEGNLIKMVTFEDEVTGLRLAERTIVDDSEVLPKGKPHVDTMKVLRIFVTMIEVTLMSALSFALGYGISKVLF